MSDKIHQFVRGVHDIAVNTRPHELHQQVVRALLDIAEHTKPEWYRPIVDWGLATGTVALALLTGGLFIATFLLARTTARLARETVNASILADVHHQESQSGLVVWMGDRTIFFNFNGILISGYLSNVGPGAATGISINICGPNPETDTHIGVMMPTLASGQEYPAVEIDPSVNASLPMRKPYLWEVKLPPGASRDQLLNQGTTFTVNYSTIYERQRKTWYPVGGRSSDQSGTVLLQYIQEFIDLNRDERLAAVLGSS